MFGAPTLTQEQRVSTAKKYCIASFFLLPWLAIVNFWFFWRDVLQAGGDARIKKFVLIGLAGAVVEIVVILSWMSVYLTHWTRWGATGDDLSVNIPFGDT
eukprot:c6481_g1_i1.p2 GENE.c6481_g1_i1~~c6481_g1_i1.p2  ORF type:complete len:100 (+),score=16.57 c6481_g1_i1:55-354(+)